MIFFTYITTIAVFLSCVQVTLGLPQVSRRANEPGTLLGRRYIARALPAIRDVPESRVFFESSPPLARAVRFNAAQRKAASQARRDATLSKQGPPPSRVVDGHAQAPVAAVPANVSTTQISTSTSIPLSHETANSGKKGGRKSNNGSGAGRSRKTRKVAKL